MLNQLISNFKFLNLISNLNFYIIYHDEKKYGTPSYFVEESCWGLVDSKNYCDFDIKVNDYQIQNIVEYIIEKRKKIEYYEYLVNEREFFYSELSTSLKESTSRIEHLQILINIEEFLSSINWGYETFMEIFEPYNFPTEFITNKRVEIHPNPLEKYSKGDEFTLTVLSTFVSQQKIVLEGTLNYIHRQVDLINQMKDTEFKGRSRSSNDLLWNKNETDLLELIVALTETKSITNSDGNLSRKDVYEIFSQIFNTPLKDAESKLTRATSRKKDVSPYLSSLKDAFDNYAIRKENKLDQIRG
jgi:hypothetical protein